MTAAMTAATMTAAAIVRAGDAEVVMRAPDREVEILVAGEEITITHARFGGGEQVARPHVHERHTDAFYVLEGELTFEVGREAEPVTISAGGFVAAPPHVRHGFRNDSGRPAGWLTIHARDGGFAAFMRGVRDGADVDWDICGAPADGGLPAGEAIVSRCEAAAVGDRGTRILCDLPDIFAAEWRFDTLAPSPARQLGRPLRDDAACRTLFVIEGEVEATVAGTTHIAGPGTLISMDAQCTLGCRAPARLLSLDTPG